LQTEYRPKEIVTGHAYGQTSHSSKSIETTIRHYLGAHAEHRRCRHRQTGGVDAERGHRDMTCVPSRARRLTWRTSQTAAPAHSG
jgi:hypothetical protein